MREGGNEREGEKANKYVDNAVPVSQSVKLGLSLLSPFTREARHRHTYEASERASGEVSK